MSKKFIAGFRITIILLLLMAGGLWSASNIRPTHSVIKNSITINNVDDSDAQISKYTNAIFEFDIMYKGNKTHIKLTPYIAPCRHESCNRHYIYRDNVKRDRIHIDENFVNKLNNGKFGGEINYLLVFVFILLLVIGLITIVKVMSDGIYGEKAMHNTCINCKCIICPTKIGYVSDEHHKKVNKFFGYQI